MLRAGGDGEAALAAAVAEALREEDVGMAFGALACGADIVIAEQALALGVELHVVLPFDREDFVRQSVINGGDAWLARFEHCAAAAAGVYLASPMRFVEDDEQFAFGSRTAMGMARLRAAQVHAETVQIAVCDEELGGKVAGTAADIATWQAAGGRTRQLPTMGVPRPARSRGEPRPVADRERRALRVLVFADFQGFSRLPEQVIPQFWQTIMRGCAKALVPHAEAILATNTWGDGLHLVIDRVEAAAPALLDLRQTLLGLDLGELGIEGVSGMRIAAHFGSVYEMVDPVTGRLNFYGTEVSRAARLEAVTPPGKVYITEPMAAAVEMACTGAFQSRYVGRLTLPKNFGTERIYALEQRVPR
jgi:class 3 adenylate cyclase